MEKFSTTLARYAALISIALQLCCTPAAAQVLTIPGQYGVNTQMPTNYVKNKGCYTGVRDITASGGSLTKNTTTPLENGADCAIDASASGQTYSFSTYNFDRALAGQNCEARFVYKGDASLYKAYVLVNSVKATNDLQLTVSTTNPQTVSMNFPCGAQPLTTAIVIESTSSSAAAINVAQVYAGLATNIGNVAQASIVGTADQAGAASCSFSENTSTGESTYVTLGSAGSCASVWTVTGALTAPAATTSAQTYNNMPPGAYEITIDAPFFTDTAGVCNFQINDGTNSFGFLQVGNAANATGGPLVGIIQYTTAASRTFSIQAADTHAGACFALNNVAGRKISWSFKKLPLSSELAYRANCLLDGSCENTFYAAVSAAGAVSGENVDWINGNCSLSTARFTCTFNTGFFTVTPVCYASANESSGSNVVAATTNGTISTSSVQVDTKLGAADTAKQFILVCNRTGTDLRPSNPAPILVGSVTSQSTGVERIERVRVASQCTSTPCTITDQSGSWVSSISRSSTGVYTLNLTSGTFSSGPTCTGATTGSGANNWIEFLSPGTSTVTINCFTASTTPLASDCGMDIICMGPR